MGSVGIRVQDDEMTWPQREIEPSKMNRDAWMLTAVKIFIIGTHTRRKRIKEQIIDVYILRRNAVLRVGGCYYQQGQVHEHFVHLNNANLQFPDIFIRILDLF